MSAPLPQVYLRRFETGDDGTFGTVTTPSGLQLYSGELPFRDNMANFSCIPPGSYRAEFTESAHMKDANGNPVSHYILTGVPGHQGIRIHSGVWCGDTKKNLKSHSDGCVLLGRAIMPIAGQKGLSSPKDAVSAFETDLERAPFLLVISGVC